MNLQRGRTDDAIPSSPLRSRLEDCTFTGGNLAQWGIKAALSGDGYENGGSQ
jgi:hypothetical protein